MGLQQWLVAWWGDGGVAVTTEMVERWRRKIQKVVVEEECKRSNKEGGA